MNLPYSNLQDITKVIRDRYFTHLFVLPYNRFDIKHTQFWWLSPTSEKAAFRYAKAIVTTDDKFVDYGSAFCGLHIEKGLKNSAGVFNRNFDMDSGWFWHKFVEISNLPLAEKVDEACHDVDDTLQMIVTAGLIQEESSRSLVKFVADGRGALPEQLRRRRWNSQRSSEVYHLFRVRHFDSPFH